MTVPTTVLGDVRSTILTPLLGWKFEYNINPSIVNTSVTNSGSVAQTNSMALLTAPGATASLAQITSLRNLAVLPGLGVVVRFTAAFTEGVAGTTQYIGIGDDYNGFFFGYTGSEYGILQRTDGSLSWTAQTSWTQTLIGDGFADTITPTKLNAYQITFSASRVGLISFYIQDPIGGKWILVHTIQHGNNSSAPAIYHVNLPLNAQVANTTTAATTAVSLYTSSAAAFTEGTESEYLLEIHGHRSASVTNFTTEKLILSLQNSTTFAGVTNGKVCIMENLSVATSSSSPISLNFLKNSILTNATFTDVDATSSVVKYDSSTVTALSTSGTSLYSFMLGKEDATLIDLSSMQFTMNPGDIITISANPVETSNTSSVYLTVGWEEE
ncbi:MAG: hypothetical protein H6Q74_980 [Firmicutes bacterium]|nr:hypothetical protein [Bacillota bacterium]